MTDWKEHMARQLAGAPEPRTRTPNAFEDPVSSPQTPYPFRSLLDIPIERGWYPGSASTDTSSRDLSAVPVMARPYVSVGMTCGAAPAGTGPAYWCDVPMAAPVKPSGPSALARIEGIERRVTALEIAPIAEPSTADLHARVGALEAAPKPRSWADVAHEKLPKLDKFSGGNIIVMLVTAVVVLGLAQLKLR